MNSKALSKYSTIFLITCLLGVFSVHQASAQQLVEGLPPITKTKGKKDGTNEEKANTSRDNESSKVSAPDYSRTGDAVLAPFYSIVAEPAKSTVQILNGRRRIAMGTIIDESGLILTKASELKGDLKCALFDGRKLDATVFGIHKQTDLALIKVNSENLTPIRLSEVETPISGTWVVTPDNNAKPLSVGVVSVEPREIKHHPGYMGVRFVITREEPTIESVDSNTPAERAGFKTGDVIIKVNGEETKTREKLVPKIQSFRPGDRVKITVLREEKEVELAVTLGNSRTLNPNNERRNQQNRMGSRNSRRNDDFPLAFQHDTPLSRDEIGSAVLDINGNVIGINIARQGRVSSLALPISIVLPVINELKSGQLSPEIVNKARVEEIEQELESLVKTIEGLPRNKERWENKFEDTSAREEELQRIFDDIKKRLDSIKKDREKAKEELDAIKSQMRDSVRTKERLEAEREKLLFGDNDN